MEERLKTTLIKYLEIPLGYRVCNLAIINENDSNLTKPLIASLKTKENKEMIYVDCNFAKSINSFLFLHSKRVKNNTQPALKWLYIVVNIG